MNAVQIHRIEEVIRSRDVFHSTYNRCLLDSEIGAKKEFYRIKQQWDAAVLEDKDRYIIFEYVSYRQGTYEYILCNYPLDRNDHSLEYYKGASAELDAIYTELIVIIEPQKLNPRRLVVYPCSR